MEKVVVFLIGFMMVLYVSISLSLHLHLGDKEVSFYFLIIINLFAHQQLFYCLTVFRKQTRFSFTY